MSFVFRNILYTIFSLILLAYGSEQCLGNDEVGYNIPVGNIDINEKCKFNEFVIIPKLVQMDNFSEFLTKIERIKSIGASKIFGHSVIYSPDKLFVSYLKVKNQLGMIPGNSTSQNKLDLEKQHFTEAIQKFDATIDLCFKSVLNPAQDSEASLLLKRVANFAKILQKKGLTDTSDLSTIFKRIYKKIMYDSPPILRFFPDIKNSLINDVIIKNLSTQIMKNPLLNSPYDKISMGNNFILKNSSTPTMEDFLPNPLSEEAFNTIASFSNTSIEAFDIIQIVIIMLKLPEESAISGLIKICVKFENTKRFKNFIPFGRLTPYNFLVPSANGCNPPSEEKNKGSLDLFFEFEKNTGVLTSLSFILYEGLKTKYVPGYISELKYDENDFIITAAYLLSLGYDRSVMIKILEYCTSADPKI